MRLAIVTRLVGFNDGQGRVNYEIAAEALRQGHAIDLVCETADAGLFARGAVGRVFNTPEWVPTRLLKDQVLARRNAAFLRRNTGAYDIVLANGFATYAAADVNAVHFVHHAWLANSFHPWLQRASARSLYHRFYTWANARFERNAFKRSEAIVAVSQTVRRELIASGVPASTIIVIPNGVDPEEFAPGPDQRARFGLPQDVALGIFAGDLKGTRKNLDTVLRALPSVPGLHLAVAGRHEGTPWSAMARDLGVADRVHFLGFQTDMPGLMRSADLAVFPSRYDPFGLVVLEALATGKPVITTRATGASDLVTPDVGEVVEDTEDAAALAAALRPFVNRAHGAGMASAARALAQRHSWQAMAGRYLELFAQVAAAKVARASSPRTRRRVVSAREAIHA